MQRTMPLTLRYKMNAEWRLRIYAWERWVLDTVDVRALSNGLGHFFQQFDRLVDGLRGTDDSDTHLPYFFRTSHTKRTECS
jgi:hypothetical protein